MTKQILARWLTCLALTLPCAAAAEELSFERYDELEDAMDEADVRRAATTPNTQEREEATAAAIESRRVLVQFLSDWLASGQLEGDVADYARNARSVLIENLIQIHSEIGECEEGGRLLVAIADLRNSEDEELRNAHAAAVDAVDRCEAEQERLLAEPVMEPRGGHGAGVALAIVGSAMAVGGAAWNFALLDDRAEYQRLERTCTSELDPCNDRAEELSANLGVAPRAGIAALIIGGVITSGLGIRTAVRADDMVPIDAELSLTRGGGAVRMRLRW